ncbi:hypothetical protein NMG60_11009239 [Bertholletia excelsa]
MSASPCSPASVSFYLNTGFSHNRAPPIVSRATNVTSINSRLKCYVKQGGRSDSASSRHASIHKLGESHVPGSLCTTGLCSCGRRRFVEVIGTAFLPIPPPSYASDPKEMLNSVRPPRPDWYEELYASFMERGTKTYEAEVAKYKSQLFTNLRGTAETVLEVGIGTGPNLKYYANGSSVYVIGIDPNQKMEKYAQRAAASAGLPPTNFTFKQAVAEALPISDASVDVVVGTLVLCSVKDVELALKEVRRVLKPGGKYLFVEHVAAKDGTILRSVQGFLNPLQQIVVDGCHLTRTTGTNISEAGFSDVDINTAFLSSAFFINPHIYGIACK